MKNLTKHTALFLILTSFMTLWAKKEPDSTKTTSDQCTVSGLFYTVQLGVFSNPVSDEAFPDAAKPIYHVKRNDGLYSYFSGVFDDRFDALLKRYDIVKGGMYEAYVTAYYNGQRITLSDANDLIAEHGEAVLYNSDKSEFYTEKTK